MMYSRIWFEEKLAQGITFEQVATEALSGPVAKVSASSLLAAVRKAAADALGVSAGAIHVVGSTRYGFSLTDGSVFDPAFSDLDLAVVDADLYERCGGRTGSGAGEARFPEIELPTSERRTIKDRFDKISRSVSRHFLYVSAAVFPDYTELVAAQADRIRAYVEGSTGGVTGRPVSQFAQLSREHFWNAMDSGIPRRLGGIESSTPSNSSPWVVGLKDFSRAFGIDPARALRIRALDGALQKLSDLVNVECCLVGGSFLDLDNTEPNDLDIVVFYRARQDVDFELGKALQRLSRSFLLSKIDTRFVPVDVSPWVMVKLTAFFVMLYQSQRCSAAHAERGLVLIVPESKATDQSCLGL